MKKDINNITLAIYPNRLGFGYVCLEGQRDLLDYGIVKVRPLCNFRIMKRIEKFVTYFKPTLILVKNPNGRYTQNSKRLDRLFRRIVAFSKRNNIEVHHYTREQIKNVFDQMDKGTKYQIAHFIAKEFTALKPRLPKIRKLWMSEDYNMGIFDALSLALTHYYLRE